MKYKNDYINSLVNLQRGEENRNIWSEILVSFFEGHSFDDVPYYQSQLLDDSTLFEISVFTGINLSDLENFTYDSSSENIKIIKWLLNNINYVTHVQKLNLSYLLSSMTRYKLSQKVLESIDYDKLLPKEKGYYLLQKFFVLERQNLKINFEEEFLAIKNIIEEDVYTLSAEMVFICQAIAFSVKSNIISDELLEFFVDRGLHNRDKLSSKSSNDINVNLSLSNFYRSYAMIFMKNNVEKMVECMNNCQKHANKIIPKNRFEELKKIEALKTYHESSLKAELYLTKNFDKAINHSNEMLNMDPNWSIFKRERALVYKLSGNIYEEIEWLDKATSYYSPLYILSMFDKAKAYSVLDAEKAIYIYKTILELDALNYSSAIEGYKLTKNTNDSIYFLNILDGFVKNGYISKEEIEKDKENYE